MPSEGVRPGQENGTAMKKSYSSSSSGSNSSHGTNKALDDVIANKTTRCSDGREHHRVTFAEEIDEYVQGQDGSVMTSENDVMTLNGRTMTPSDSGIVTSESGMVTSETDDTFANISDVTDDSLISPGSAYNQTWIEAARLTPILKITRSNSVESHDNPFLTTGELRRKADYILAHSRIVRRGLWIADPDRSDAGRPALSTATSKPNDCSAVRPSLLAPLCSSPRYIDVSPLSADGHSPPTLGGGGDVGVPLIGVDDVRPVLDGHESNGSVANRRPASAVVGGLSLPQTEVVRAGSAGDGRSGSPAMLMRAEQIDLRNGKAKCCIVQ